MASCFRTASSRLCCSNYLKTSQTVHLDMNSLGISSSKITPNECCKETQSNYSFQIATINNISNHKYSFSNNQPLIHQNTIIPFPSSNLTSQDIIMWYRRKNGLLQTCPPVSNESFKNTLRLAKTMPSQDTEEPTNCGRPSNEHLENAFLILSTDLPQMFVKRMNLSIFNRNVILENNIRGTRHVGIGHYVSQIALLKAAAHVRFAHVKLVVLKITKHPEDGTIKCRWRIKGIGLLRTLLAFFSTFSAAKTSEAITEAPTWYDGFSIYYLNSEGEIYKHVIDKMQPDDDKVTDEKPNITKLAMCLGLTPQKDQALFMNIIKDYYENNAYLSEVMLPLDKIE